jgi:hypothetical protein
MVDTKSIMPPTVRLGIFVQRLPVKENPSLPAGVAGQERFQYTRLYPVLPLVWFYTAGDE